MASKLDEYSDVISRLVGETVSCSPASWERGMLSIQCDGTRITYQLKSDHSSDKAVISEVLRDLIDELYVRMSRNGDVWQEAFFNWWRENNDLKFNVDFNYAQATELGGETPTSPAKRAWWKFR